LEVAEGRLNRDRVQGYPFQRFRSRGHEQLHCQPGLPGDGRAPLGQAVSLEKSLQVANEMLAARGPAAAIRLEEGSGISRNNHFTARGCTAGSRIASREGTRMRQHDSH
jgi:hypothetical protein